MNSFLRSGFVVCLVMLTAMAQAASDVPRIPTTADVRVIVDISGSMKQNDPQNLRQPAIRLLAEMLPEGSTAGVWTFGEYVNMLVPHGKVDQAWRKLAIKRSAQINSVALRTNLGRAMKVASDTFYSGGNLEHTHFILLTDGKVDISPDEAANEAERRRVLDEVLGRYKKLGATVHTVALSDEADLDFLTTLATQTGGSESVAQSADQLNLAFLRALNSAVPQAQIPIRDNGFKVDDGVREFTVLVFSGPTDTPLALKAPDGRRIGFDRQPEGVRWVKESSYDLITVDNPVAGRWLIDGTLGEGSRVTVVSDLKMVVSPLPARFYKGESVDVAATFYDGDKRITDPDFLSVITVSLSLTTNDGRSGTKVLSADQPPADGVYRDQISKLEQPGDYTVSLVADGQTFSREFTGMIALRPPVRVVVNATGAGDQSSYQVSVIPEQPGIRPDASSAVMTIAHGDQTRTVDLPYSKSDQAWVGAVENVGEPGDYQVSLQFKGVTETDQALNYQPEPFAAHFPRERTEQNVRIPLTMPAAEPPQETAPTAEAQPEKSPAAAQPDVVEPPEQKPETVQAPEEKSAPVESNDGPVDLSMLEKPEPAAKPAPLAEQKPDDSASINPVFMLAGAGVVALLAIIGGALWWRRRKTGADAEVDSTASEDVTDELPTLDPNADGELPEDTEEVTAGPEDEIPELAAESGEVDEAIPELEPESSEVDEEIPELEPDAIDEEDVPSLDELAEDDIEQIIQQAEQAKSRDPEPVSEEDEIPLATDEAVPELQDQAESEDDQDIFDMEDFDLSDIDDLPDLDEPEDGRDRKKD